MLRFKLFSRLLATATLVATCAQADTLLSTASYGYTGGNQTYTVPSGTNYVVIKAWGAGGANGTVAGGGGGFVSARYTVSAGQTITVSVGGGGTWGVYTWPTPSGGGWNGGGNAADVSGGGGGRTSVATPAGTVYAGGGGGSSWCGNSGSGGAGGGADGQSGASGGSTASANGGGAGTLSGVGGGGSGYYENGTAGSGGTGGTGGTDGGPYESSTGWYVDLAAPGGGGGGGYYGGGGGGTGNRSSGGGGGGGGSSYASGSATNITYTGGSGYTPGGTGDPSYPGSGIGYGATSTWGAGANGYVVIQAYQTSSVPTITSTGQQNRAQNQAAGYSITTTGTPAPTSYGATGLPPGYSVNTSTGVITGNATTPGTYNSTVSATNSVGTGNGSVTWVITAASITTSASITPASILDGGTVTLTRAGTANFGLAWTENTIWLPSGQADVLGNQQLGSQNYTPAAGLGTYHYQFRLVDTYSNYQDQWLSFTVVPAAPTSFQSNSVLSTSAAFSWGAVSGASGYNLYRDGSKVNTTLITGTTHTDTPVTAGTAFSYTVRAVGPGGVESGNSTAINVTTAAPLEIFTPAL